MTETNNTQRPVPTLLHVLLYALGMCALCLGMTHAEPAASVDSIRNTLYAFAGIFALFVVGILGYAVYATRGEEPEGVAR